MNTSLKFLTVTAFALCAQAGLAQTAGSWSARVGATHIQPHNPSDNLTAPSLPSSKTDVGAATQLSGGITYMLSNHWAVDVPLALPFKHKLYGAGALAGVGQVGEVKALPFTVTAQYRFMDAQAKVRPYVGLGLTYAYFFAETGSGALTALTNPGGAPTVIGIESKWALSPQIGVVLQLNDKWFADLSYTKTLLKTTTALSTGQTVQAKLNPDTVSVTVGWRF